MRIFLTGATGFIGSHVRRALARDGHQVVGLARRSQPEEADVTWITGDITDPEILAHGMHGCDAVIHLVGILKEQGEATFARMHVQGTETVLAAMRRGRVKRLLHMSALGAGPRQSTGYYRTKWAAEEAVRASGLDYTILRPAIVFGPGDGFINKLVDLLRQYPVIPIPGSGDYPLAPISVHAVVSVLMQVLGEYGPTIARTFEVSGPEVHTYLHIVNLLTDYLHIRKPRIYVPIKLLRLGINMLGFARISPPITHDQLNMLLQGSVCNDTEANRVFDLPHITLAEGIREYLQPRR